MIASGYINLHILEKRKMFKIMEMYNGHTCSMNIVIGAHRHIFSSIASNRMRYKYTFSHTVYTPYDISNDMLHRYRASVNYMKAWKSCKQALKLIRDDPTTTFQLLPSYFYMLQQINIGTITRTKTYHLNRFNYFSMALGASITS